MRNIGELFRELSIEIDSILNSEFRRKEKLYRICKLLKDKVSHYDWVGFYFVNPDNRRELILGPYSGEPTEHEVISFGQGICGQAAEIRDTFVVQDISEEPNYLSCSPEVKSEIVIPLMKNDDIIGELDIDSHKVRPFTENDRKFLEDISCKISILFRE